MPFGFCLGCYENFLRCLGDESTFSATLEIWDTNIFWWVAIEYTLDTGYLRISFVCDFWFLNSSFWYVWVIIKFSIRFSVFDFLGAKAPFYPWNFGGHVSCWGESTLGYTYYNMDFLYDKCQINQGSFDGFPIL